jgi:heptosyltransferase-2
MSREHFVSKNVLIRGVNWVGDSVMTMPAIRALRKSMPDANLSLLVKPWVSSLFEKDPSINRIISYDDNYKGITGKLKLSRLLRRDNFSLAILFPNAFDAAFITALAGIPRRIGYNRDYRGLLLTDPVPYSGEDLGMHHINYYLELLRKAGIEAEYSEPWIYLGLEERLNARNIIKSMKRPVIGITPGAAYGSAKRWFPERFAKVAKMIIEELNGSVVIDTLDSDIDDFLRSAVQNSERMLSTGGKTTIRELSAIISECDILLTNDSGPMHLGYAVKTPLVTIFGPTDPLIHGPVGAGTVVIKKDTDCSPCYRRQCNKSQVECMEAITADDVFSALKSLVPVNKAVFFDRDGTLNLDVNYLSKWSNFKVLPDLTSLNGLINNGFKLIGITNQSGIARGYIEEDFVRDVNSYFIERHGFEGFYYCPHHPDENCPCRKPEPEMLLRARAEHRIDLRSSYMVGDNEKDMLVAKAAGVKSVLVRTGKIKGSPNADFTANGLKEAVDWILKDNQAPST